MEAERRRAQAQERASKQASKRETTLESTNQPINSSPTQRLTCSIFARVVTGTRRLFKQLADSYSYTHARPLTHLSRSPRTPDLSVCGTQGSRDDGPCVDRGQGGLGLQGGTSAPQETGQGHGEGRSSMGEGRVGRCGNMEVDSADVMKGDVVA